MDEILDISGTAGGEYIIFETLREKYGTLVKYWRR
jgi:hypothetical protein